MSAGAWACPQIVCTSLFQGVHRIRGHEASTDYVYILTWTILERRAMLGRSFSCWPALLASTVGPMCTDFVDRGTGLPIGSSPLTSRYIGLRGITYPKFHGHLWPTTWNYAVTSTQPSGNLWPLGRNTRPPWSTIGAPFLDGGCFTRPAAGSGSTCPLNS